MQIRELDQQTQECKKQSKSRKAMAPPRAKAITRFVEFLRFRTISSEGTNGSYQQCAQWLCQYFKEVGLDCEMFSLVEGKPIVLATWKGKDASLPKLLLNCHYDVVPVMPECWDSDPFDAKVLDDGFIYGRGSQDMKCVGIQYVEAIWKLKQRGFVPKRNVHLTFCPDEEIGGTHGMASFLKSDFYKAIQPVGFALDEGIANPNNCYTVFYGERSPWWFHIKATGPTGHASRFVPDTATSKIINVCNKAMAFRAQQECALSEKNKVKLGDVTTINATILQAGVSSDGGKTFAQNVIPNEAKVGFDMRVTPSMSFGDVERMLDEWCAEEEGVTWEFASERNHVRKHAVTSLDEAQNPWWKVFKESFEKRGLPIEPEVFPAATDSRFLRHLGIPALGFSPMRNTPILLHEHNEKLHKDVFLEGIDVYESLLEDLLSSDQV